MYYTNPALPEGHFIQVTHLRRIGNGGHEDFYMTRAGFREEGLQPHTKGGMTIAELYDGNNDNVELIDSVTVSCYHKDNFSRAIGRQIAIGRLLKKRGMLPRQIRAAIDR